MNTKNFLHNSSIYFGADLFGREFISNVQRVTLPGITFNNIQLSKTAINFYTQGDTPVYNALSLDILIDENLYVWREIITKLQTMTKIENGAGDMTLMPFTSFIQIFNEKDESVIRLKFIECFLENIGDLEFEASGDDTIMTLNMGINYAFYKVENLKEQITKKDFEEKSVYNRAIVSENYNKFKGEK